MSTISVNGYQYQQARKRLLAVATHCYWCHRPITDQVPAGHPAKATADHYPPRSIAGDHLNLVAACTRCNYGHVAERHHQAQQTHTRQW